MIVGTLIKKPKGKERRGGRTGYSVSLESKDDCIRPLAGIAPFKGQIFHKDTQLSRQSSTLQAEFPALVNSEDN